MNAPLSDEVIAMLAAKFRRQNPYGSDLLDDVQRLKSAWTTMIPACAEPIEMALPGYTESPLLLGTDGSVGTNGVVSAWAAITGDGLAVAGWFTEQSPATASSNVAELAAIRYGLRYIPDGATVQVRCDSYAAIDAVGYLLDPDPDRHVTGNRPPTWWADHETLAELIQHVTRLDLSITYIGDPEGTTLSTRAPAEPTMRTAHRTAWLLQRLLTYGHNPYDDDVREFLMHFARGQARSLNSLRTQFQAWHNSR